MSSILEREEPDIIGLEDTIPSDHLFTGISYVPPDKEELALKIGRIKICMNSAYRDLLEIFEREEWKADPRYYSWDQFCQMNFDFSGRQGRRLAHALRINDALKIAGQAPIVERQARMVSDLPIEKAVEVIKEGRQISKDKKVTGLAEKFHKPGKLSCPIIEEARRKIIPEKPVGDDAVILPPSKPRRYTEPADIQFQVTPTYKSVAANKFGICYHFTIDGKSHYLEVSAADFAKFFEDKEGDPAIFDA